MKYNLYKKCEMSNFLQKIIVIFDTRTVGLCKRNASCSDIKLDNKANVAAV